MELSNLDAFILGIIQGIAELLPVSSSAHVILAEKILGLDPRSPSQTWLLVVLHTGTMAAVLTYFGKSWLTSWKTSNSNKQDILKSLLIATLTTIVVGGVLSQIAVKLLLHGQSHAEVEDLFGKLPLISLALAITGCTILFSSRYSNRFGNKLVSVNQYRSLIIGAIQGLCLPFRGLSRSGMTISTAMITGVEHTEAESFSFAIGVLITPLAIIKELYRLIHHETFSKDIAVHLLGQSLVGFLAAFIFGHLALQFLTNFLNRGRWVWFSYYCFAFSAVVLAVSVKSHMPS
jgi:undecaprenyl-diphosphatase